MHTLRTIVATAVVTLAATTVAYAGMNGMDGRSAAVPAPAKAIAAHQEQVGAAYAAGPGAKAKVERKHERQVVRHRNEAQHEVKHTASSAQTTRARTHEASHERTHATAAVQTRDRDRDQTRDRDQSCDPDRARDCDQTRDRTCDQDQVCDQTRDQSCRQSGSPTGEHAGDGGHAGEGCGG